MQDNTSSEYDNIRRNAERDIIKLYRKELWSKFTRAVNEYRLILPGDKIAVCISGGKDSFLMAKLFQELMAHGERNFEALFLTMDPGYNEKNRDLIRENALKLGVELTRFESSIFEIVDKNEGSPCYPCARMRRGALYSHAKELGCNKIALGHHYDDVIETILMGMLYGGQIQTMMPKLHSTNFEGMELIRPMYLIREEDIKHWCNYNELKFIACACKMTEKRDAAVNPGDVSKRAEIKGLIRELREKSPYIESNIFKSVENVHLNAIISYKTNKTGRHHFLDTYDEDNL